MTDEDGYPTEEELTKVREWPYLDPFGLMAFVKERWYLADWGWEETASPTDANERGFRFRISTAGWSGNESLIAAMEQNWMFWALCWYSSRRGGHYEFLVKAL